MVYQQAESGDIIVASEEPANGNHRGLHAAHCYQDQREDLHTHTPNEHAITAQSVDDDGVEHHQTCHEGDLAYCQGDAFGDDLTGDSHEATMRHAEAQLTVVVEVAAEDEDHDQVVDNRGIHRSTDAPMEDTDKQQIEQDVDDTSNNDCTGYHLRAAIGLGKAAYGIIDEERQQVEQEEETQIGLGIAGNGGIGANERHQQVAEQPACHGQQ